MLSISDVHGVSSLINFFREKIVFETPKDNYFTVYNTQVIKPSKSPGRGLASVDSNVLEFQAYINSDENKLFEDNNNLRDLTEPNPKEYLEDFPVPFDY